MIDEPLVTIGVPTFNRPESLSITLKSIINQTYSNLEIIISDNCSTNPEVQKIIEEFATKDHRITTYSQSSNLGAIGNLNFVLSKASGNYFIWAADDDEWQGKDFLALLVKYAHENILTFPDAATFDDPELCLLTSYENCKSKLDYVKTFCSMGWGYPFYGLYNLNLFNQHNLKFEFDTDLAYYSEGTFLHKLFLTGPAKYVKEAKILYTPNGSLPSNEILIDNFVTYFKRTLLIYASADLPQKDRFELLNRVFKTYTVHISGLFEDFISFDRLATTENKMALVKKKNAAEKILFRIKRATTVLVKGN
ncbi:MAG: glycosyltransferase family 2 protein [Ginsengibacter sp.]